MVGDKVGLQHHAVADAESLKLLHVRFRVAVEFARHDELCPQRLEAFVGHCLEQQVEPLVVADETEEEDVTVPGVEAEHLQRLLPSETGSIVVIKGMGTESARLAMSGIEDVYVGQHRAAHGHHAVDRPHEIFGKQLVARTLLVGHQIVEDGNAFGAFRQSVHCAQCRRHEGQPEFGDQQVGALPLDVASHTQPVEGVDGVEPTCNLQPFRGRLVAVLRLPGEEERRVLEREGHYLHLMPQRLVFACQPLVESRQPTSVGPSCTQNDNPHVIYF